ncbi:MAG: hypothetical protein U0T73_06020 [Chitinophagales bacterium]
MSKNRHRVTESKPAWWTRLDTLRIDLRSLALFRIFLGISVLYNLIVVKWSYAVQFYGAHTILPHLVQLNVNGANSYSIFSVIHNDTFAYVFIATGILTSALLTLGVYSRIMAWATLFIFWNLIQASSYYCFGFDFYTFQMLFWACFLPLDAHFAILPKARFKPALSFSIVILFQIAWVYFATGLAKYGPSWSEGFAVRVMLMDRWTGNAAGTWLSEQPVLYALLTYFTLVAEYLFPFAVFDFTKGKWLRYFGVLFLFVFHLTIFSMYSVANFSISGFAVACLLLPNIFWRRLEEGFRFTRPVELPSVRWTQRQRKLAWTFCIFAIVVILEKNLDFLSRHSAFRKEDSAPIAIDIPSPVKTSFFLQYWKMFAPNPPSLIGWWTLEGEKDGKPYDFMAERPVTNDTFPLWHPTGYEYYLAMYSRNFPVKERGDKFKLFLKYWIPYMKAKKGISGPVNLAYFNYLVLDQSAPYTPRIEKTLVPDTFFTNVRYVIEQDPSQ